MTPSGFLQGGPWQGPIEESFRRLLEMVALVGSLRGSFRWSSKGAPIARPFKGPQNVKVLEVASLAFYADGVV